jgi:menaquinone-dependent protoporphyrinogen oxidase
MNILLLHSSTDGHTIRIMQHIADHLAGRGNCEIVDLNPQPHVPVRAYDRVIVGASIRYGKFSPLLYQFVTDHKDDLETVDAAYFGVNLTARKPGKENPDTSPYIKRFLKTSPWQPRRIALFAGALNYSMYGFFDRNMIRFIMKITGGPTAKSTDVVFTNWQAVGAFVDEIAAP